MKKICIIGCGTYGSYLLHRILEDHGSEVQVTVVELGGEKIKSNEEVGLKTSSQNSKAASDGRYFGLGGTSARWGGQILFFDKRDNPSNDPSWNHIVTINEKYKDKVVTKVLGQKHILKDDIDQVKTGVWLKYSKRNLYKQIPKSLRKNCTFITDYRVTDFTVSDQSISSIDLKSIDGNTKTLEADQFYLTAGAIESCRLLKKLVPDNQWLGSNFGDHISLEVFKVKGQKPVFFNEDFTPQIINGSLVTKRLVINTSDKRVSFAHPIFNKEVKVFSAIKSFLFGKQRLSIVPKDILTGVEFLFRFAWNVFIRKQLYVHRNNWSIQLDLEQDFPNDNTIDLSSEKDGYGESGINLKWAISSKDKACLLEAVDHVEDILKQNNIEYVRQIPKEISYEKVEDTYHPVGFINLGVDHNAVLNKKYQVKPFNNLFHFSTAMFPSARSINPTAAGFCLIEDHLENELKNLS